MTQPQPTVATRVEVKIFYGDPVDVEEQIKTWLEQVPQGSRIEASPAVVVDMGTPPKVVKEMSAVIPLNPQNNGRPQIVPAREIPS